MNISTLGAIGGVGAVRSVAAVSSTTRSSNAARASPSNDQADISGPAQMLSKLKSLQKSDPEKFKQVMAEVSDSLSKQAATVTDPNERKMLTDLAEKFWKAKDSGDLSGLEPPKGGRGPQGAQGPQGPPPPPPSGKSSSSSSSKATDPADTNEDGTVSQAEKAAYEAKQATSGAQAYLKRAAAGPPDNMASVIKGIESIIDSAL
ncbi:MAG: hypothetical protein U0271_47045 [Polyangiaceae bacterium]